MTTTHRSTATSPGFRDELLEHHGFLQRLAGALVRDPQAAADLVQQTWLVAIERPPARGVGRGWLARVIRSLASNHRIAERRRREREAAVAREEAWSDDEVVEHLVRGEVVLRAVRRLREPYRTVIFLRYYAELGPTAIARRLDLPLGTVKARLVRARQLLRRALVRDLGRERRSPLWVPFLLGGRPPRPPARELGAAAAAATVLVGAGVASLLVLGPADPRAVPLHRAVRVDAPPESADAVRADPVRRAARTDLPRRRPVAQDPSFVVEMEIEPIERATFWRSPALRDEDGATLAACMEPGRSYTIDVGARQPLQVATRTGDDATFFLRVDRDDDGDLGEEPEREVRFGDEVVVELRRASGPGVRGPCRYAFSIERDARAQRDRLKWAALYRARGELRIGNVAAVVTLNDATGDGVFDRRDFGVGTTVWVDLDRDGRGGPGEMLAGDQIFELADLELEIEDVRPDGSELRLRRAELSIPALGEPLPDLGLKTLTGAPVTQSGRARPVLFMLWATWCVPCIEKIPIVERLARGGGADLYLYDVDEAHRRAAVERVVRERGLEEARVIVPGAGRRDALWRMVNSRPGNSNGVPKFVLLDRNGVLRYAGENLGNLEEALRDPTRTSPGAIAEDPGLHRIDVDLDRARDGMRFDGVLEFMDERAAIRVVDLTGDGRLDEQDFAAGPCVRIDRDGDGTFSAPDEELWRQQAFAWAGGQFKIRSIASDGSRISFHKSLSIPRIGRRVRGLIVHTREGVTVLGRPGGAKLLVFWSLASTESARRAARIAERARARGIDVIHYNVDSRERMRDAVAWGREHGWEDDRTAVTGKGRDDFLWQLFAGVPGVRMDAPLFAQIDGDGVLQWVGGDAAAIEERLR